MLFFDHTNPGPRHPIWSAAGVRAVVWYRGSSTATVPSGWTPWDVMFSHSALGGVTDGQFRIQLGLWDDIGFIPPWVAVGITATLHQVINPTFGGRGFPGGRPVGGTLNTSEGLLSWTCRHDMVVVPMVYPACPNAECHLSGSELLAALEVPGG